MSTDLTRVGAKARKEPDLVFTTLYHHVTDSDNLRDCYEALDGVTKEQYGENLGENLQDLSDRLKRIWKETEGTGLQSIPRCHTAGRPDQT